MTSAEINKVLDLHLLWLRNDPFGVRADLQGADLRDAHLQGADLQGADLQGAHLFPFQIVPSKGSFVGWKKVDNFVGGSVILELRIPAKAKRTSSLVGRKCRASEVVVVEAIGRPKDLGEVYTSKVKSYGVVRYSVGRTTKADKWDDDIRVECTSGIHFFMTKEEAEAF